MHTFDQAWRYESVRLQELETPDFDDTHANERALECGQDVRAQLLARADELARVNGTNDAQDRATKVMRMGIGVFWAIGLAIGLSAGFASLGDSARPVNLLWALGSLLLVPSLTLLAWCVLMFARLGTGGWLGHWWLWLVSRLFKTAQAGRVWRAWLNLSDHANTQRWWLALATHGMWFTVMSGVLLSMIMAFSLRHYTFVWETTWLGEDIFVHLAKLIGSVPVMLGFAVPDAQMIRNSGNTAVDLPAIRMAWASWLVGAVLVFGWLPRLVLLVASAWVLRYRYKNYQQSLDDAYALSIRAKLARLQDKHQVDGPAGASDQWQTLTGIAAEQALSEAVWLAFESSPDAKVHNALTASADEIAAVDDHQSRQAAVRHLQHLLPKRLLMVFDARQTPDRGTLRAVLAFGANAVQTRVLLINASDARARNVAWQARLSSCGVSPPYQALSAAAYWLQGRSDGH
jgi:hypothetical protein